MKRQICCFIKPQYLQYLYWKNVKKSYKSNKFKITAATWSEKFELPDGSYSVSDIQDYFEYILKTWSKNWQPFSKTIPK